MSKPLNHSYLPKMLTGLLIYVAKQSKLQKAQNFASMNALIASPTSSVMPNTASHQQPFPALHRLCLSLCLGIALLTGACSSHTSVSSSWTDPKQRNSQFNRVIGGLSSSFSVGPRRRKIKNIAARAVMVIAATLGISLARNP